MISTGAAATQGSPGGLLPGAVFSGRYEIVRCIKAGGMGAVYEAVHLETKRRRALKVMLQGIVANAEMRSRFKLEATVAADIESEHIVETLDAGVDDASGAPFLVMELLRGDDLAAVLQSRRRLLPEEVVVLLGHLAMALEKTHAAGIVHRDLKPENLFITRRDDGSPRLKVLDFGIAKVVAQSNRTSGQTRGMGTPLYMSPEQVQGDGRIGPASDLYAVGLIAYTLLVGEPYFEEEASRSESLFPLLLRVAQGIEEPASRRALRRKGVALPTAFDGWFAKATALREHARFGGALELVNALSLALGPAQRASAPVLPRESGELATSDTMWAGDAGPTETFPAVGHAVPTRASKPAPSAPVDVLAQRRGHTTGAVSSDPVAPPPTHSMKPLVFGVAGLAVLASAVLAGVKLGSTREPHDAAAKQAHAGPAAPPDTAAPSAEAPMATLGATTTALPGPPATPGSSSNTPPPAVPGRPPGTSKTLKTATSSSAAPPPPPPPQLDCNPPYLVGPDGSRHAKPQCL